MDEECNEQPACHLLRIVGQLLKHPAQRLQTSTSTNTHTNFRLAQSYQMHRPLSPQAQDILQSQHAECHPEDWRHMLTLARCTIFIAYQSILWLVMSQGHGGQGGSTNTQPGMLPGISRKRNVRSKF
mmetsp:Transcript_6963/g.13145  ORF Transcript_6963/g.13145 Transcript_6963/m.13145 type:complete len:127 (-) Transcript_6963:2863-3243(-)